MNHPQLKLIPLLIHLAATTFNQIIIKEMTKTPSNSTPTRKLRLRIKSAQKVNYEHEERPKSSNCKRTTKKNNDTFKPKKPPTAFFFFLEDFRRGYQEENPQVKSMRDIGKAAGEKWKIMSYDEKVKYYDIATEKRAKFDKAMAEYIRKKESAEIALSEDSAPESDIN